MSVSVAAHTDLIHVVAALESEIGVLSVYVDASPERKMHQRPAWERPLRSGLATVTSAFVAEHPTAGPRTLAHLASLEHVIAELSTPYAAGRGRALFSAIDGETLGPLWTQGAFPDRVVLGRLPCLWPLVAAVDEARPAGAVVVSATQLRFIEMRGTQAEDLATFRFDDDTSDWRELRGPAGSARGTARSTSQSDLFARRKVQHRSQWLAGMAIRLGEHVASRGWDHTLVLADAAIARELTEHIPSVQWVLAGHGTHAGTPEAIAAQVRDRLTEARRHARADLVTRVVDAAVSGGNGAVGWLDVGTVLEEGRVHTLLIDPARVAANPLHKEVVPSTDQFIVRAVQTDAEVVTVTAGAARLLAPHGGVAALLRW
jgi:Bacterial archaeo-eukaryotic release factor family 5